VDSFKAHNGTTNPDTQDAVAAFIEALLKAKKYDEALKQAQDTIRELEALKASSPDEIHLQMAKLKSLLEQVERAQRAGIQPR
jgi:hypothetical protein